MNKSGEVFRRTSVLASFFGSSGDLCCRWSWTSCARAGQKVMSSWPEKQVKLISVNCRFKWSLSTFVFCWGLCTVVEGVECLLGGREVVVEINPRGERVPLQVVVVCVVACWLFAINHAKTIILLKMISLTRIKWSFWQWVQQQGLSFVTLRMELVSDGFVV